MKIVLKFTADYEDRMAIAEYLSSKYDYPEKRVASRDDVIDFISDCINLGLAEVGASSGLLMEPYRK